MAKFTHFNVMPSSISCAQEFSSVCANRSLLKGVDVYLNIQRVCLKLYYELNFDL